MPYELIEVDPITPVIGARIGGIDLHEELSDQLFAEIYAALLEHLVLFLTPQDIAPAAFTSFVQRFGDLEMSSFLPRLEGCAEITVLTNDRDHPPAVNVWHTDSTFLDIPPKAAALWAREVPPSGGDTVWCSMYSAYDALADALKEMLSELTALHKVDASMFEKALREKVTFRRGASGHIEQEPDTIEISAVHPVIHTHPETGRKALFVNSGSTRALNGVPKAESDAILEMLFAHVRTPEFQVRCQWRKNAIALWDNRCTQHYAVADYWPHTRIMYRASIAGESRPS